MGVDPALFSEMAKEGRDGMNILDVEILKKLRVYNDGYGKTAWTIESNGNALYAKGQRLTWRGVNKFIIACDRKFSLAYIIVFFDSQGRDDDILQMGYHFLYIDGKTYPLKEPPGEKPSYTNGMINGTFFATKEMIQKMALAQSIGIYFQSSAHAPFFFGFDGMDMAGGRDKIIGYLEYCKN